MTSSTKVCTACNAPILAGAIDGHCTVCCLRVALLFEGECDSESPGEGMVGTPKSDFPGYQIKGELGRGGMGVVYRALDEASGTEVAIKVLQRRWGRSGQERERFEREVEAACALDHPNIVPVLRVVRQRAQTFLVMRLLEGPSLAEILRRREGRIAPVSGRSSSAGNLNLANLGDQGDEILGQGESVSLLLTLARAVHHAHSRGVIHRDLKPSNILFDSEGKPHIVDFGLAKQLGFDGDLTQSSEMLGSPHYMSPEQATGGSRHANTSFDVYSLGVIFFQMLTGRRPYVGATAVEIFTKVRVGGARFSKVEGSRIHPDLQVICLKCIELDPARRYGSADALARDLERWVRGEPIHARPPKALDKLLRFVGRSPIQAALLLLFAVGILMSAVFSFSSYRTYRYLMDRVASEHLISAPDDKGNYRLHLHPHSDARCTFNFWRVPFGYETGRWARVWFEAVTPELARNMRVQVWSDIPAYPDIPKTKDLTNGQAFMIYGFKSWERAFYFMAQNFGASNVLYRCPDAAIRVELCGFEGDPDPYKPAGHLRQHERQ